MINFEEDSRREGFKLREDYFPSFYNFLLVKARGALEELASTGKHEKEKEKIELLRQLGIKKVCLGLARFPLNRVYCSGDAIHKALLARKNEADKYLKKYKAQFEADSRDGKFEMSLLEQQEFSFRGYCGNIQILDDGIRREQGRWVYARRSAKRK